MDKATFLRNLEYGHIGEEFARRHLALCGHHVVSVYADAENKAPKVYVGDRMITAADLFFVDDKGRANWVEVKSKKKPGYRYLGAWRGFEHGVDFRHFDGDYREQASRALFWIVVREELTMPGGDADWEPPPAPKGADGQADYRDYERHLVPGPVWRAISFRDAERFGRRVDKWSEGKVGWLWPVSAMTRFTLIE
jgi:hypothetical protein